MSLKVFLSVGTAVVVIAVVLAGLLGHLTLRAPGVATRLYRKHLGATRRERLFLASVTFFLTFFVLRGITHAIHAGIGPFHDVSVGGTHVHHLVWGILLLLAVSYGWLAQVGTGLADSSPWGSRAMALLYGIAAALTLDEFALWLRLADVYWSREGRESVEAVLLFGGLLSVGVWGGPFFRALGRESARVVRRSW
jgi:hypothetical protein